MSRRCSFRDIDSQQFISASKTASLYFPLRHLAKRLVISRKVFPKRTFCSFNKVSLLMKMLASVTSFRHACVSRIFHWLLWESFVLSPAEVLFLSFSFFFRCTGKCTIMLNRAFFPLYMYIRSLYRYAYLFVSFSWIAKYKYRCKYESSVPLEVSKSFTPWD